MTAAERQGALSTALFNCLETDEHPLLRFQKNSKLFQSKIFSVVVSVFRQDWAWRNVSG
jgi:hypothetical protein